MPIAATPEGAIASSTPHTAPRRDIQGLRALAVLLVVLYHAEIPFVPAGFAGVDVFFVISGFVITSQIRRQHAAGSFGFARFYARRVKRLWPAMTVMVLVVLSLTFLLLSPLGPQAMVAQTAIGAMLAAGNIAILRSTGGYFDPAATTNPLLHVWSLAVEEQFYLVFPAVLVLCLRWRRVALPLTALSAASFVVCLAMSGSDLAFYSSFTRAWEFGVGALLTLGGRRRGHLPALSRVSGLLGLAGLAGLVGMNLLLDDSTVWPGPATLIPVLATAALIVSGTLETGVVQRVLSVGPLVWLGDLSYSVYLWHWPAIVFAELLWPDAPLAPVLAAAFSLVPAYLGYRLVEQPLRFRSARSRRVLGAGLVTSAVVTALALAVSVLGPAVIPGAARYASDQQTTTWGRRNGCMIQGTAVQVADIARCTSSVDDEKGTVLLVGDSHADMLSDGVIAAAGRLGYGTTALTGSGCGFSRTAPPSQEGNDCAGIAAMLLDRATGSQDRPALVVLSQWLAPHLRRNPDWLETLRPALTELHEAGIPVVFALDTPAFAEEGSPRSSACAGGWLNFGCSESLSEVERIAGDSRAVSQRFAQSLPWVTVLDPWPVFCGTSECSAVVDGRLAYYDFNHLNAVGSTALEKPLATAMRAALGQ
ncbi:acyltransferase [Kineosporia sp. J2-2]|uniref:Acyltransferase n=1 Tax=Kineosporia corallincola TaxID=2835133 RepID=A0ABS5TEG6_9ACTN|nr:acyltransferase family protein [Kineosporia corallincola]MBT0769457.1 acyltransferase [Kineosporia corallincola]